MEIYLLIYYSFVFNTYVIPYFLDYVECEEVFCLSSTKTLQNAVENVLKFLGMSAANGTEKVPEGTHTHTLLCSGNVLKFFMWFICSTLLGVEFS